MPSTVLLFGLLLIYVAMSGRLMGVINITQTLLNSDLFKNLGDKLKKDKVIKDGGFAKDKDDEEDLPDNPPGDDERKVT